MMARRWLWREIVGAEGDDTVMGRSTVVEIEARSTVVMVERDGDCEAVMVEEDDGCGGAMAMRWSGAMGDDVLVVMAGGD
ncbi:hypothetical protein F0562_017053 [Nyssa sinensis]|uniref:Uncharacterized protein n=1 Tax=Nyssa sinensis TaxID=561372 RepID=A0A5J4ZFG6_9ASTE|nr:hypothetical protein F0562_017053 [Nyssa sinensis]